MKLTQQTLPKAEQFAKLKSLNDKIDQNTNFFPNCQLLMAIFVSHFCYLQVSRVFFNADSLASDYTANIYRMVIGNFIGNPLSA